MKSIPEMYKEALTKPERLRTDQEKAIIKAYELRHQATQEATAKLAEPLPKVSTKPKSAREMITEATSKPENQRTEAEKLALLAIENIKKAGLNALSR